MLLSASLFKRPWSRDDLALPSIKNGTIFCQMAVFDVEQTVWVHRNSESLILTLNELEIIQYIYNDLTLLCCGSLILQHVVLSFFIYLANLYAPQADQNSLDERAQNVKTLAVLVLNRAIIV